MNKTSKVGALSVVVCALLLAGCPRETVDQCSGANPHPECSNALPGDAGNDHGTVPDATAPDGSAADANDGTAACGGGCEGTTPVCDEASDTCVACLETTDCTTGVCAADKTCVDCLATADCDDGVCDTTTNTCVACLTDSECNDVGASRCDTTTNTCTPCVDSSNCAHLAATTVCDVGECVECTGLEFDECNGVCDSRLRTCTDLIAADQGLCEECVSDAQCRPGMLCVPMLFDAADNSGPAEVGTYCLWQRDATVANAPNGSCFGVPPYVRAAEYTSIDGVVDMLCELRTTTCPGLNSVDTDCPVAGMDEACGASGFDDGLCVALDAVTNRCSVVCLGNDDCKLGSSCDTTVTPNRCQL